MVWATRNATGSLVSGDVRTHNLSLIAGCLAARGPLSRSQLADATGLTRGAVTALVGALADAGLVREATTADRPTNDADNPAANAANVTNNAANDAGGLVNGAVAHSIDPVAPQTSAGARKGRPLTLLELAAERVALVALQLDADQAIALVTSLDGRMLTRVAEHHGRPMGDPDRILDVAAGVLTRALDQCASLGRRVADLTVVVFAPVGGDPAIVIADTDLDWGTVDVIGGLRARAPGMPDARLVADSSVAALAELRMLDGVVDLVYLKSNSGIGGAIVTGGRLLVGANGMAGALGHIPIDHDGERCACGQRGCLVTVAGPDLILDAAGLGERRTRDGLTVALAELVARIDAGERRATAAWDAALPWIARELHILTMSVDPGAIVVGGYWAELAESIGREFERGGPAVVTAEQYRGAPVLAGRLGDDVALLGAIWSARDRLLQDPLALSV